jgi:hypothetical protein
MTQQQHSTVMFKVKIEQPVATVENTTGPAWAKRVAEHRRVTDELAREGYFFTVGYQGISTFAKPGHPDRHFTTNLALQTVECDLWGYALTT